MIDALAFLGRHPFRGAGTEDAGELEALLMRLGFERAFVVGLEALFGRDVWRANELHLRRLAGRKLLAPLAGVNPSYAVDRERVEGLRELGFRAAVVAPLYHGFSPRDRAVGRLLRLAADAGLPVVLLGWLEDVRGMHRAYRFRFRLDERGLAEFVGLAAGAGARVLLSRVEYGLLERLAGAARGAEVYVDVAHNTVYGPAYDRVASLVELYGEERVVLSTGAPLDYPLVHVLKVLSSNLSEAAKRRILRENALELYGS